MAQLTGIISKTSNENSNLTKYIFPSDLDDDLNSSLCDLLSQSNESFDEMSQRDMEEKRAKNEEEEKNRKEEEAELEKNNQEKDGEEEKTLSSQAVKRKEEYEKLQKELERAKKIRIEIEEEQKQKNMVAERSIMEDIEKIEKIEREEKEMKEKEEEEKRIRWKPVVDLEIDYKRSLRFANQAREIADHAKLMLDAATLHANK